MAKRDDLLKADADGEPYLELGGVKAFVKPMDECERADFVVCGPRSYFPDDVWTTCSHCAAPICHRPYVPSHPPKICITCMLRTAGR